MSHQAPDALLLIAPGCPHCAAVLEALSSLVKEGEIGTLEVINLGARPQRAQALGVRSVPWMRIGDFELDGRHSPGELRAWAERVGRREGIVAYLHDQLGSNRLSRLETILARRSDWLPSLLDLLADPQIDLKIRLGADALLETVADPDALRTVQDQLEAMAADPEPRIRADAAHYLAMARTEAAASILRAMLSDPDESVREQAAEALKDW